MPKAKKFNLTQTQTTADQERMIGALTALQAHEGWMLLRQTLEANIKVLDAQIIDKTDIDGQPINDAQCDKLRDRRAVMHELVNKPDALLEQLQRVEQEEASDDPYYTDPKQFRGKAPNKVQSADE